MTTKMPSNISHEQRNDSLKEAFHTIVTKIKNRKDLPFTSVEKQLELVDLLTQSALGQYLLERGGLNGFWADYVIKYPIRGRLTGLNNEMKPLNEIEAFLLNHAPTTLATQQRFEIFKTEIQKRLFSGVSLASIPCGLMADLLDLDFRKVTNFTLTGIDLDPEPLVYAEQYAKQLNITDKCTFIQGNAWALRSKETFDLITSNGLSVYEPDDAKVTKLYRGFFRALKPRGYLVTSFLTHPPASGVKCGWKLDKINMQDALLQKVLFVDILEGKWQIFRSEEVVISQLRQAGFHEIEVIYDNAHIFPTIIARA